MNKGQAWIIARREWRATVLRREFLLMTFGIPLLFLLIGGITVAGSADTMLHANSETRVASVVGVYDPARTLDSVVYTRPFGGTRYRRVDRLQDGQSDVAGGRLRALIALPANYVRTGAFTLYRRTPRGLFDASSSQTLSPDTVVLRAGLIGRRLPRALAKRVIQPVAASGAAIYEWNAKRRRFQAPDPLQQVSMFFVPYGFAVLLLMTIFLGTGYLLHGIIDEKENRVMEILLSSVSHEDLLRGKLLGLGGAGLTQMAVWALMAGLPALLVLSHLPPSLRIAPGTIALALVLFVLGFLFYGSLMAAFGSLSSSWRESQQVTSVVALCAVIPLLMLPAILDAPNGSLARGLSWFPPTAPITLMLRSAAGSVPLWDLALAMGLLLAAIWAVQKMTVKLFRLGLLLYGKPPTFPEVIHWMKAA